MIMGQCSHEEADTRIVVHARHILETGAESILVRKADTDIVVILVSSDIQIVQVNLIHTADHPVGTHRKPP